MASYRIVDIGASFKKIVIGRKWIGRVVKHHTEQRYLGIIGKTTISAPTEREAFEEIVARHCGFASAAMLRANNAEIRQRNRQEKADARYVVGEIMNGNFKPFLDRLTKENK